MAFQEISKKYLNILMSNQMLHFFRISLAPSVTVFPINLVLHLNLFSLEISTLELFASSLE